MNTLISMALKESLERLDVVSHNTVQTKNEVNFIYNKHQEDIRNISSLLSIANLNKDLSDNMLDMISSLEKLMVSKQKDVAELRKVIDYATESSIEISKARSWINGTMDSN